MINDDAFSARSVFLQSSIVVLLVAGRQQFTMHDYFLALLNVTFFDVSVAFATDCRAFSFCSYIAIASRFRNGVTSLHFRRDWKYDQRNAFLRHVNIELFYSHFFQIM